MTELELASMEALKRIEEKMRRLDYRVRLLAPSVLAAYKGGISNTSIENAQTRAHLLAQALDELKELSDLKISHIEILKEYI